MVTEKEFLQVLEDLFNSGKFEEVISSSEEYSTQYPSSFQIGFIRCKALLKFGKFDEAEYEIDNLLKLFPENINLLVEKGFLMLKKNRNSEAKDFFDKALFQDPYNQRAKKGIDHVKKFESGKEIPEKESPMSFVSYEKEKANLEDTISESDLEKLMENKNVNNLGKFSMEDSSPNVSISFEDSSIKNRNEMLDRYKDPESRNDPDAGKSNIETALKELNRLSDSDFKDLKLEEEKNENQDEQEEKKNIVENEAGSFLTESAAILYLKQGLYKDAENIYIKLYRESDSDLFREKMDMIRNVKLLQTKIVLLRNLLNIMKRTGETIV